MQNNIIYNWKFEDKKNRSTTWYIIALSIIIGLVIWGFLTKQYGMSFIILLISGISYFVENNSPDEINVNITDLGIKVGDIFYDYSKITSYSFIYNGENAVLLRLSLNKKGLRYIDLIVNNNIVMELNGLLNNYIEENPKGELSFGEKLIKSLKL